MTVDIAWTDQRLAKLETTALAGAKWAFTTRRVLAPDANALVRDLSRARAGDLVLGRIASIGSHKKLQLACGRPSQLYPGDLVVVACGARYAPDQFEGLASLTPKVADLLAGGGVLGCMRVRNGRMAAPTRVAPLGLISNAAGRIINVGDYAIAPAPRPDIPIIAVVGASMNSGKTTAVASLVHGLVRAGHRVAAIKATGTGAFGDYNAYLDAGANHVADFVDAGMASTYMEPRQRIIAGTDALLAQAAGEGCSLAVVELADGVLQCETRALLADPGYRAVFSACLFAAPDALAAKGGVDVLAGLGIKPLALTGLLGQSPMAMEEAQGATGIEVLTREALQDPACANALLTRVLVASGYGLCAA